MPIRPNGTVLAMFCWNPSACSWLKPILPNIGVAIGPGLSELTRIFRDFRSAVKVRRKVADSRLRCAVDAPGFETLRRGDRGVEDDRRAVAKQRQRLLHGEENPLDVDRELAVEFLFAHFTEGTKRAAAGIGEYDIQMAVLVFDDREQAVEIGHFRYIARHGQRRRADRTDRFVQFFLPPPGDDDLRSFRREQLAVSCPMPLVAPVTRAIFPSSFAMSMLLEYVR